MQLLLVVVDPVSEYKMSKQDIDIGVQGNDGTGDSIRESFRKVNENFTELYAVFGAGGQIRFTNLSDAPLKLIDGVMTPSYNANDVIMGAADGSRLSARTLIPGEGISIDVTNPDSITITNSLSTTASDPAPRLGGPLNAQGFSIGKLADPSEALVIAFNAVHGPKGYTTTIDELAISKGYADSHYIKASGGTATDALRVRDEPTLPQISDPDYDPSLPGNYVATEAMQRQHAVRRDGDKMTGNLFLSDHPGALAGVGTPNGADDLQAASKYYVDNSTYSSAVNLYVNTKGDDTQQLSPRGKEGRFWNYAYKTVGAAALAADSLIAVSQTEPGPYRQRLAYTQGVNQTFSTITDFRVSGGNSADNGYVAAFDLLRANKEFIQYETIAYINNKYVNTFTYDKAKCQRDIAFILDAVAKDLVLQTNFNSVRAATRYYDVASAKVLSNQLLQTVDGIKYARDQILGFQYSTTNLQSYINNVIDAICLDLIYQSNLQTTFVALAYTSSNTNVEMNEIVSTLTNLKSTLINLVAVNQVPASVTFISTLIDNMVNVIETGELPTVVFPSLSGTTQAQVAARELLVANIPFIEAEVIAYLANEYQGLSYNSTTCKRDIKFMVWAVIYDTVYGGNSLSNYAGQQYWINSTQQIAAGEVSATLAAIKYINGLSSYILQNQSPPIVYQQTTRQYRNQTYSSSTGSGSDAVAVRLGVQQKLDIILSIVSSGALTYDQTKCARDVQLIIDSVFDDLIFGTNYRSVTAGLSYLRSYSSVVTTSQSGQTIAGVNKARDLCLALMSDSGAIATVTANFKIVTDIIAGGLNAAPALVFPSPSTTTNIINAVAVLRANRTFLQSEIVAYVNDTQNPGAIPNYDASICYRDVGYVIDALSYDLLYGGNKGIVLSGTSYYNGALNTISGEVTVNVNAYTHLQALISNIVTNTVVTKATSNSASQNVSLTAGTTAEGTTLSNLLGNLLTFVNGSSVSTTYPTWTNGNSSYYTIRNTVTAQKTTISASVVSYLNATYYTLIPSTIANAPTELRSIRTAILGTNNANRNTISAAQVTYINANFPVINDAGALATITTSFQYVIDLLNNGISTRPTVTYTAPDSLDTGIANAVTLMLNNIQFVQEEIIGYVNGQFPGFSYDQAKCKRDLKYIIEAVAYDLLYGGNSASTYAAQCYWIGSVSQVTGQITQTINAINQAQTLLIDLTQNVVQSVSRQTPAFNVAQYRNTGLGGGAAATNTINTLFNLIKNIVQNNPGNLTSVDPDLTSVDYSAINQGIADIITSETDTIKNQVTTYLDTTYAGGFNYDEAICFRDVGYIIEAMAIDLITGGTYQSVNAGQSYYRNTSAKAIAIGTQYKETLDGIQYAQTLATQVLNKTTATRYQTLYTQKLDLTGSVLPSSLIGIGIGSGSANPSTAAKNTFTANMATLISIIKNGFGVAPVPSFGSATWRVQFTNGGNGFVDQGSPSNNDILPAKVLVGVGSSAYSTIVTYTQGSVGGTGNIDTITCRLTKPAYYTVGEYLEFGETVKDLQIVIFVEAGIYYEDYPIKLAPNVSVKGDEFRRTIIRPKDRISQSPWRKTLFYRDAVIDGMQLGLIDNSIDYRSATTATPSATSNDIVITLGSGTAPQSWIGKVFQDDVGSPIPGKAIINSVSNNFMNCTVVYPFANVATLTNSQWHIYDTVKYGRHYLTNPLDPSSTAKNNKEMDVFLCNDATRISNLSLQGHGGFAMVLDPTGQILTKSPYGQVCSSFSQSLNRKRWAGGQFIDGFAGRLRGTIVASADNGKTLTVTGNVNSGLDVRPPQPPCAFYISGTRYQINDIVSYNSTTRTVVMTLDNNTLWDGGFKYNQTKCSRDVGLILDGLGYDIVYGTNYQAVNAGRSYLRSYSSVVLGNIQLPKTVAALNQLRDTVVALSGVDSTADAAIIDRMNTIVNILNGGTTYSGVPKLVYTKATCQRDVGYIIDAIGYDMMFGSNFQTVKAAMSYYRNDAYNVIATEKEATISAMFYLKGLIAAAIPSYASTTNSLFDTAISIFRNGLGSVPSFTLPTPTAGTDNAYVAGYLNAARLINANKTFLQKEITAWINVQKAGNISPFTTSYSYDVTKCEQDVGYIVDALRYDLTYGGNLQTTIAARAYFAGAVSQYGSGQKAATIAAFTYLKSIIDEIVTATLVPKSTGNTQTQDQTGTAGTSTPATRAQTLIQQIITTITNDGVLAATETPSTAWVTAGIVTANTTLQSNKTTWQSYVTTYLDNNYSVAINYPTPSWQAAAYGYARDLLQRNRYFIQNEIVAWIADNYNVALITAYDPTVCARDVGLVVDAVIYDMMYGGNSATQDAALAYYRSGISYIPGEETVTAAAYGRLKTVMQQVVQNTTVTKSSQNTLIQITDASNAGTSTQATAIGTLIDIIVDIIPDGATATAITYPTNTTGVSSSLTTAKSTITSNKSTLQTYVINFLNNGLGTVINIEMGGNKSMLANDFAMINDLGYGIVAKNGGVTEQVSTFSYYCHTHYWAADGGQIRSVAGSNSHGDYGLRSSGYDVTELPDEVNLANNMMQVARVYKQGDFINEMTPTATTQSIAVYILGYDYLPMNISELEIDHNLDGLGIVRYEVSSVERTAVTVNAVNVIKLNLSRAGNNGTSSVGLVSALYDGQMIQLRILQNAKYLNIANVNPTRPSTALQFSNSLADIYRVIVYNLTESVGELLPANVAVLQTDTSFAYYKFVIDPATLNTTDPIEPSKKLGGQVGDTRLAVIAITNNAIIAQVNKGLYLFSWAGRVYNVLSYTPADSTVVTAYNPTGSSGTTLVVADTTGIKAGMTITGTGFTTQTVVSVNSLTQLTISGAPGTTPSGNLSFASVIPPYLTISPVPVKNIGAVGVGVSGMSYNAITSNSNNVYFVTYDIPWQETAPIVDTYLTMSGNSNANYNGARQITGLTNQTIVTVADTSSIVVGMIVTASTISGACYVGKVLNGRQFTITPAQYIPAGTTVTATKIATLGSLVITNPGSNYARAPIITISGGGASVDAKATCTVAGGQIVAVSVVNPGYGYTSTPTVTIENVGDNNAVLTPVLTALASTNVTANAGVSSAQVKVAYTTNPGTVGAETTITPLSFTSKTLVSGTTYNVVFGFSSTTAPTTNKYYNVTGNANPLYNGLWKCTASSSTTITLQYTYDPGTFVTATGLVISAAAKTGSGPYLVNYTIPSQTAVPQLGIYYSVTGNANALTNTTLTATATTVSSDTVQPNWVTVSASGRLSVGCPITFGTTLGNIVSGTQYYVASIPDSTHITLSTTQFGSVMVQVTASGSSTGTFGLQSTFTDATHITLSYGADPGTYGANTTTITPIATATAVTTVAISATTSSTGISKPFYSNNPTTIRLGYPANSVGQVTTRISTCRATGHDFLDIGTGGYSTTNYPYQIYGNPAISKKPENEIYEEGVGRVFYVTTDQNGIFRVGRYFTVDQGTGTVTFSASIALSNLDGIGFKRGVVVSEFSTDSTMTNNAPDTVPVQSAVRGYIDKRLGIDHGGSPVAAANLIGSGYMSLGGTLGMKAAMNLNNYNIINLAAPSNSNDASTKAYVDTSIGNIDSTYKLLDTYYGTPTAGEFVVAPGGGVSGLITAGVTGDLSATFTMVAPSTLAVAITSLLAGDVTTITVANASGYPAGPGYLKVDNEIFSYGTVNYGANRFDTVVRLSTRTTGKFNVNSGNTPATHSIGASVISLDNTVLNLQINANTIVDADVNTLAAIAQSKLALNLATANATSPTGTATQKQAASGLSTFDSTYLTVTDGWVSIKDNSIPQSKHANIGNGSILANFSGSATYPQEVSALTVLNNGFAQKFTTGVGAMTYGGSSGSAAILSITSDGTASTLVKYGTSGEIDTKFLKINGYTSLTTASNSLQFTTPGSYQFLSANGTSGANFVATVGGTWDFSGATLKAPTITTGAAGTGGSIVGQYAVQASSQIDFSLGTLKSNNLTSGSAATSGTITGQWALAGSSQFDATAGTLKSYTLTTGSSSAVGSITGAWGITGSFQATYADLAEFYEGDQEYEPGTVLVFGGDKEVTTTTIINDTRSAGVVTTDPAYVMNKDQKGIKVCIALAGRVPVKVIGRVKKGDMLTTSATPGYAVRANTPTLGAVIGKALEDKDYGEAGVIQVAVGRV